MLSRLCLILLTASFLRGDFALATGEIPSNAPKVFLNNITSLEALLTHLCHTKSLHILSHLLSLYRKSAIEFTHTMW